MPLPKPFTPSSHAFTIPYALSHGIVLYAGMTENTNNRPTLRVGKGSPCFQNEGVVYTHLTKLDVGGVLR